MTSVDRFMFIVLFITPPVFLALCIVAHSFSESAIRATVFEYGKKRCCHEVVIFRDFENVPNLIFV